VGSGFSVRGASTTSPGKVVADSHLLQEVVLHLEPLLGVPLAEPTPCFDSWTVRQNQRVYAVCTF